MVKCAFCSEIVKQGRGKTLVTLDSRALSFCSPKCGNNYKLGRNPKKVNWVRKAKK